MNFKKFISGVSALTIAASAFAGMAVTANAADTYEILFGTAIEDADGNTTGVTPQTDFTTDSSTKTVNTYDNYKIEDSVLAGNQANGRNYNFSEPVTTGQVHFSAMAYYVGGDYNFWKIMAKDTDGEDVVIVASPTSLPSGSGETTVLRVNGTNVTASYVYTPRTVVYYHDVTINFTSGKIEYTVYYASKGSSGTVTGYSSVTDSVDIPENIASIVGVNMPRLGGSGNNYYDSVSLYAKTPSASSHVYTINAVDGNGNTITQLAADTAEEGEEYGVTGLAKVIASDGKYYVLDDANVTDYAETFTMGSADETKTITYTEDPSIVFYGEAENLNKKYESESATASAGKTAAIDGGKRAGLGSLDAGAYEMEVLITANAGRNIVLRDDNAISAQSELGTASSTGTNKVSFTLPATTYVLATGRTANNSAQTGFALNQSADYDYIIIRRTGDYTGSEKTTVNAELVKASSDSDDAYKGAVYKAEVSGEDSYSYEYLAATVTPADTAQYAPQTKYVKANITGAGSVAVAIALEGIRASEVSTVSVTLK